MMPLSMYMEKSMLYIDGMPVIRHIVSKLYHELTDKITIVVLKKFAKDFHHEFRDMPDVRIYTIDEPVGTVATYQHAAAQFAQDEEILLHYADSVAEGIHYKELVKAFQMVQADCMLAVTKNIHHEYSQVLFDRMGRVWQFVEKPTLSEHTWSGIACFKKDAVDKAVDHAIRYVGNTHTQGGLDFATHIFPAMIAQLQNIQVYTFDGPYVDAGNILSYWRLQRENQDKDKA